MADLSHITKTKVEVVLTLPAADGGWLVPVFKRAGKNGESWYALAGGKFAETGNEDETIYDGAIRETDEELGVKLSIDDIKAVFEEQLNHPKTPTTLTSFVLAACPKGQYPHNVDPNENGELMFLRPDAASRIIGDRATEEVHDFLNRLAIRAKMENTPS